MHWNLCQIYIMFSYIMPRTIYIRWDDDDDNGRFVLNQLLLVNDMCLAKKQQILMYSLWFDSTGSRTDDLPLSRR
jgi:hypothetical protein